MPSPFARGDRIPLFRRVALAVLAPAVLVLSLVATPAFADDRCDVPLGAWQPREALQKKLESEGWAVSRIRTDDGCYKAYGRDAQGALVKGRFDPATLERLDGGHRDDHRGDHGGGHHGEDD